MSTNYRASKQVREEMFFEKAQLVTEGGTGANLEYQCMWNFRRKPKAQNQQMPQNFFPSFVIYILWGQFIQ